MRSRARWLASCTCGARPGAKIAPPAQGSFQCGGDSRSLRLLEESISRDELRRQFREASVRVRASTLEAIRELDPLVNEGLDDA